MRRKDVLKTLTFRDTGLSMPTANPTEDFWELWRAEKFALREMGFRVYKKWVVVDLELEDSVETDSEMRIKELERQVRRLQRHIDVLESETQYE